VNVVRFLFNLCGVRVLIRTFIWLPLNYSLCLLCEHGCNTYTAATLSPWAARIKSLLASKSKRRMLDVPSNTTTGAAYLTVQTRSWPGRVFKNKNLSLSLSLSLSLCACLVSKNHSVIFPVNPVPSLSAVRFAQAKRIASQ